MLSTEEDVVNMLTQQTNQPTNNTMISYKKFVMKNLRVRNIAISGMVVTCSYEN